MDLKSFISGVIEDELLDSDHFIVGVHSNSTETDLKFFIDGVNGVDIKLCSRLSRKVSRLLDEQDYDDTPIRFEISSPGADRPLIDHRQYPQHAGRDLKVELNNGSVIEGELTQVTPEGIEIAVDQGKNKVKKQEIHFNEINISTVKISFKSKKK